MCFYAKPEENLHAVHSLYMVSTFNSFLLSKQFYEQINVEGERCGAII